MARSDITGDSIANTKGSAEKYAQGWDAIFAPKKQTEITISAEHGIVFPTDPDGVDMRITPDGALEFKGLSKEESKRITEGFINTGKMLARRDEAAWAKYSSNMQELAHEYEVVEPTVVMALDFHDSTPTPEQIAAACRAWDGMDMYESA